MFPQADAPGASLSNVVFSPALPEMGYVCRYLLSQVDLGPLHCAKRREIGAGWVLYESNGPYAPNPIFKRERWWDVSDEGTPS